MRPLTPPGLAGVAVVAFDQAERAAVEALLVTRAGAPVALSGAVAGPRLLALRIDDQVIDEVLVVDRGGRGIELHLHGSPAVVAALVARFPSRTGEQAAAAAEDLLRRALGVEQLDLALEQRAHDFAAFLRDLEAMTPAGWAGEVRAALDRSRTALAHVEPHRVVLAGAQNAGKSTLFNKLLFRERALTGAFPGLTRDPVRETTTLGGYPVDLIDTAGEGELAHAVDGIAVRAGRRLRAEATVLLVVDGGCGPGACDRELLSSTPGALVVAGKGDLPAAAWPEDVPCWMRVCAERDEPGALRERLGEALRSARGLPPAGPVGGPAALSPADYAALAAMVS